MCHAVNEKCENINNRRNRTAQSGKHQNAWREEKLEVHGNIGSKHHQRNQHEKKSKKKKGKLLKQKSHQTN